MATMKSSGDLIASISADLADNNAGLISAEDVRHNMEDIAFSINKVVASGDTETAFPFYNNVTIKKTGSSKGELYVESGIKFPNGKVRYVVVEFDNPEYGKERIKQFPELQKKYNGKLACPIEKIEFPYSLSKRETSHSFTAKVIQFPLCLGEFIIM